MGGYRSFESLQSLGGALQKELLYQEPVVAAEMGIKAVPNPITTSAMIDKSIRFLTRSFKFSTSQRSFLKLFQLKYLKILPKLIRPHGFDG